MLNAPGIRVLVLDVDLDIQRARATSIFDNEAADQNYVRHVIWRENNIGNVWDVDPALPVQICGNRNEDENEDYPDDVVHRHRCKQGLF